MSTYFFVARHCRILHPIIKYTNVYIFVSTYLHTYIFRYKLDVSILMFGNLDVAKRAKKLIRFFAREKVGPMCSSRS
jgi:hypothetical protein